MEGGKARDLIGDIHAQHRRRVLRRAVLVGVVVVVALLVALAFKIFADRAARDQALDEAREQFALGSQTDMEKAVATLEQGLVEHSGDDELTAGLALVRAHALAEFGAEPEATRAAVAAAAELETHDSNLATGTLALVDGDFDAARAALGQAGEQDGSAGIAPNHGQWLAGMLALAQPDEAAVAAAIEGVGGVLGSDGSLIAYRRLLVGLQMHAGQSDEALEELGRAREQSFAHKGLAADEALYNAVLRQRLGGVASVAEQLLADEAGLSARDVAHARLARAVVHVQSGELKEGLELLDAAWPELSNWDALSRNLALELAMEAHDSERAREWAKQAALDEDEVKIYEAWALLSEGDVMASLERLAGLPQEHRRVAYLQGLALVEQGRWEEAGPWLDRASDLIPGRVELDVARARVELRTGEKQAALRKLKGLAEEEPYAPRAWTGLGEAYLEIEEPDEAEAKKALERALEREHKPAEAMLRLAEIYDARRAKDPASAQKARELMEKAAQTNDALPRYRERLALYLAQLGHRPQAVEMLAEIIDRPGINPESALDLCRLAVEEAANGDGKTPEKLDEWLELAKEGGVEQLEIDREKARAAVLTGPKEGVEAAHQVLSGILEKNMADTDARVLYSRALQRMFEREKAVGALRRGLNMTPEAGHGPLYLEWARIEGRSGSRRKASAHARVAWLKMQGGDFSPAELLEAADIATKMFLRDRKPKPAVQIARTLTEKVPNHAAAWVIRGRSQLAANRAKEAMDSAEKAIELDESWSEAHELLGDTVLRFGYKDKAKAAYQRAVDTAETKSQADSYRSKLGKL